MSQSARQGFPYLEAGQAQKELVHNEAIALIDVATNAAVQSADLAIPPPIPVPGDCWIVAAEAGGDWTGREDAIACWTGNGWRFAAPVEGMRVRVIDQSLWAERVEGTWRIGIADVANITVEGKKIIGARGNSIADPAGGGTIDAEARLAIVSILARLRAHGLIESE